MERTPLPSPPSAHTAAQTDRPMAEAAPHEAEAASGRRFRFLGFAGGGLGRSEAFLHHADNLVDRYD